jgi:hypothetical protein
MKLAHVRVRYVSFDISGFEITGPTARELMRKMCLEDTLWGWKVNGKRPQPCLIALCCVVLCCVTCWTEQGDDLKQRVTNPVPLSRGQTKPS